MTTKNRAISAQQIGRYEHKKWGDISTKRWGDIKSHWKVLSLKSWKFGKLEVWNVDYDYVVPLLYAQGFESIRRPNDSRTYEVISAQKVSSSAEKWGKTAQVGKSAVQALNLSTTITLLFLD